MSRFRPGVFTDNYPSNTILVTYSTSHFWLCGFTNHADLRSNWSKPTIPYMTETKGSAKCSPPPESSKSMFASICHVIKMQPKLHNSVDQGISKFVYLRLHLVVCFYPRPPAWPWSWGYTYLSLKSNDLRTTSWRCQYSNEEENSEDSTINNNSDMAGWTAWSTTENLRTGTKKI